jgi:hypothetical protein
MEQLRYQFRCHMANGFAAAWDEMEKMRVRNGICLAIE